MPTFCSGEIGTKLDILGATGDAAWYGHPQTVIEKSYDGSYDVSRDNCYLPNTSTDSTAKYSIALAEVNTVKILNRHDCCG